MTVDHCTDDGGDAAAALGAALNVAACGASLLLLLLVAWARGGAPPAAGAARPRRFGLASERAVLPAAHFGLLLGAPTAALYYALPQPAQAELACVSVSINSLGLLPLALLAPALVLPLLLRDAARLWTRVGLARLLARAAAPAIVQASQLQGPAVAVPDLDGDPAPTPATPVAGEAQPAPAAVVLLGAGRGLLAAPLLRELRAALAADATSSVAGPQPALRLRLTLADAWGSGWAGEHDAGWLRANLRAEGVPLFEAGQAGAVAVPVSVAATDFTPAQPPMPPAAAAALLIPLVEALPCLADTAPDERAAREAALLRCCMLSLRPGGALALGVHTGARVRYWLAALQSAGFEAPRVQPGWSLFTLLPTRVLLAHAPAAPAPSQPQLEQLPPLAPPPPAHLHASRRPCLPPGRLWRARDAAVALTALAEGASSAAILAGFSRWLQVPGGATWNTSLGALLVSAALFAPAMVAFIAADVTAFVAGEAPPGAYEGALARRRRAAEAAGKDEADGTAPLLLGNGDATYAEAQAGAASGGAALPGATAATALEGSPAALAALLTPGDVLRRWLLRDVWVALLGLFAFQAAFWAPLYGALLLCEVGGLMGPQAAAGTAWLAVIAVSLLAWGGWERRDALAAACRCRHQGRGGEARGAPAAGLVQPAEAGKGAAW